jgi:hypothetical protein
MQRYTYGDICTSDESERFHNPCALFSTVIGVFFLEKKTLESRGFGEQQLWNRCNAATRRQMSG